LIELRDFARQPFNPNDGTAIVDYVCAQLPLDDLADSVLPLRELARRGRVLFLLDGVDEAPHQERAAIWQAIAALKNSAYGGNRWVVTCRVLSFDPDEAPTGMPVQTLQPLTESQIEQFIANWYAGLLDSGQLSREQASTKAEALQAAVKRPALYELAQNPMLLTIMALVQTFRGTLPDERAKLYQACVETLLLRWQLRVEGGESDMPDALRELGTTAEDLQRLLWEIAWEAHSKAEDRTRSADIPRWNVVDIAEAHLGSLGKAEQFLEYTEQRAHLLVGRGGRRERVYSFPHRTFQEYLAACHLAAQRRFQVRARELAAESDAWREVLNLAVGTLAFNQNNREKALDALERMLPHNAPEAADAAAWRQVWLAGEMAVVVGRQAVERDEVGQELLPRLRNLLVALLANEALTPAQRAEAGDALGVLGDPRPGVCTLEPDLIEIPTGDFLYGDNRERRTITQSFAIARYPVTLAQFGMFVEAGGYEEADYWGGKKSDGWQWRLSKHPDYRGKEPITQPRYWLQPQWHVANRPTVGVSWYEAQAYCTWLTAKSGRLYRLPTEEEWERAARHTDGRMWAWGNAWADGIINTSEAQINRTSAVGTFPRGAAACGAQDMSGNVWEWTASFSDKEQESYCVRGGSWYFDRGLAHVAYRGQCDPDFSGSYYGFRLVSPVF
jgi:formylglycine-generating enzyme required for sulfatase activity